MISGQYTQQNENCRLVAYQDSVHGVWTIGYGCTGPDIGLGTEWTQNQANAAFEQRWGAARDQAAADLGEGAWMGLDAIRQEVLSDMAYQLGCAGLAGFQNMLAAIRAQNWQMAHDACIESKYARQTQNRAQRNATILLTGQWPIGVNHG